MMLWPVATFQAKPPRQDLDEAARRGYISRPVRYNTLFKYLELEVMTPYLQQLITESSLPLKGVEVDFALDSSGFRPASMSVGMT